MIMQILGSAPFGFLVVLVVVVFVMLMAVLTYRYKINPKSAEFKVLASYVVSVSATIIVAIIAVGPLNSELLFIFIMMPPVIIFLILSLVYNLKTIRKQETDLKKVITNAEGVSINIANIAT